MRVEGGALNSCQIVLPLFRKVTVKGKKVFPFLVEPLTEETWGAGNKRKSQKLSLL